MLKAYGQYVERHAQAAEVLDAELRRGGRFEAFARQVQANPQSHGWDLSMFLITPVQRLLRYSLLFKEYRDSTLVCHPDHEEACRLVERLDAHAAAVNAQMRQEGNWKKLCAIRDAFTSCPPDVLDSIVRPDRFYVRDGQLRKVCRKTTKKRWFWLFSDCLMYGTRSPSQSGFVYHRHFPLTKVRVNPVADTGGLCFLNLPSPGVARFMLWCLVCAWYTDIKNGFQIITKDKSFTVMAETPQEKNEWLMDLRECLGEKRDAPTENTKCVYKVSTPDNPEAPVWIPDKETPICMVCAASFTVFKRRVCFCSSL